MTRRKLPIGIQTFSEIRREGHYYVDKTGFAERLIEQGKYYFLSRPRRFGKSLFLDTLKELFEGNEALFRGLHIHDRWDWSIRYPVIRISFGGGVLQNRTELDRRIDELLADNETRLGVRGPHDSFPGRFGGLIREAHAHTGQRAVVLVDEYDKPILDNMTDPETARAMRDGLRNLYSVIKDSDAHIRFAFLTGVSRIIGSMVLPLRFSPQAKEAAAEHRTLSKVSLFSGLNNLQDLTLDPRYGAICGYTANRSTGCCKPTTSKAWNSCSPPSSPASRRTGTATIPSPATKAITPACSTATSPPWGWT